MKRFVLALTLATMSFISLQPAMAGDPYWANGYAYPTQASYPQPYQPAQQGNPLLQKLIIGGILVGVGFAAGRLTAPRPQHSYPRYAAPPHAPHGHRFSHRGW